MDKPWPGSDSTKQKLSPAVAGPTWSVEGKHSSIGLVSADWWLYMMKTIRLKSGVGIWPGKFPPKHS